MSLALLCACALAAATPPSQVQNELPPALRSLEDHAEDIVDAAARDRWDDVATLVADAQRDLDQVRSSVTAAKAARAQQQLDVVRMTTRNKERLGTQLAANELARRVVDLTAPYALQVPVEVSQLDVVLREIELQAQAGSIDRAQGQYDVAVDLWNRVSMHPELHGTGAADRFAGELKGIGTALRAHNLGDVAERAAVALEGVDGLERVFETGGGINRP